MVSESRDCIKYGDRSDYCRAVPVTRLCADCFCANLKIDNSVFNTTQTEGRMKNLMEGIISASRGDVFEVVTVTEELITMIVLKPTETSVLLYSEQRQVSRLRVVSQAELTFLVSCVSSKILQVKSFSLALEPARVVEAHRRAGFSK